MKKTSKARRSPFTSNLNRQDEDVILADIQVMADDHFLAVTPMNVANNHQDTMDRMIASSGFDDHALAEISKTADFVLVEDIHQKPNDDDFAVEDTFVSIPETADENLAIAATTTDAAAVIDLDSEENRDFAAAPIMVNTATEERPAAPKMVRDKTSKPAKVASSNTLSYLLLGISTITLAITCVLAFMVAELKTEISQLKAPANIEKTAQTPEQVLP